MCLGLPKDPGTKAHCQYHGESSNFCLRSNSGTTPNNGVKGLGFMTIPKEKVPKTPIQ